MSDDKVLDFNQNLDELFKVAGKSPAEHAQPSPGTAEPAPSDGDSETALSLDKLSHFPKIGDPYVKAYPTPVRASLPMLVLLLKDGSRPTFSYSDMRFIDVVQPKEPGSGPGLLLRFIGIGTAELQGAGLDRLHGYLYLHRLAWVREWPGGRQARDDNGIVITRIKVTLLES